MENVQYSVCSGFSPSPENEGLSKQPKICEQQQMNSNCMEVKKI